MKTNKERQTRTKHSALGFTFIEALITMSVVVVVAAVTLPLYDRWQTLSTLESSRFEIIQDIRLTQNMAEAGLRDQAFGVYFASNDYTIFQGQTYATRDVAYDIDRSLPMTTVLSGLGEVTFSKKTGAPSVSGSLIITDTVNNNQESIYISLLGLVY